jgi:hypothetical protein
LLLLLLLLLLLRLLLLLLLLLLLTQPPRSDRFASAKHNSLQSSFDGQLANVMLSGDSQGCVAAVAVCVASRLSRAATDRCSTPRCLHKTQWSC